MELENSAIQGRQQWSKNKVIHTIKHFLFPQ